MEAVEDTNTNEARVDVSCCTSKSEVMVLDLKRVKRTSDLEKDLTLVPGDMLLVPQNTMTKIERYMKFANVGLYFNPLQLR